MTAEPAARAGVHIVTLAERPDLIDAMWDMPNDWPEFLLNDPHGRTFFTRLPDAFPEYQLVAVQDGEVVAKINSIPFVWTGQDDDLPDRGWDAILERGFADQQEGRPPTAVSLLEARIVREKQGTGFSTVLLRAALANTVRMELRDLFGPVRPTQKRQWPAEPMTDYVQRFRHDGLPEDPWLRTHARMGARIVKVCPLAMTVAATLPQWRAWTGLPFDRSGPQEVDGSLNPVLVSVEHDYAIYVEPNVWMHHQAPNILES